MNQELPGNTVTLTLHELIPILQLSVGPVILISGVGLLLLSMTNRLGRIVDRSRTFSALLKQSAGTERTAQLAQLGILARRARLMRAAIVLGVVSVLLTALLIICLFVGALIGLAVVGLLVGLFVLCLLSLIGALTLFLLELNQSLRALWLELPKA